MGKIGSILFFASMVFILLALLPLGSARIPMYIAVPPAMFFGMLAFVFSVLAVFFDKSKNTNFGLKMQSLVFYIGLMTIYVGLVFWIMHWPGSRLLTIVGAIIAALSYLLKFTIKEKEDDLLDS